MASSLESNRTATLYSLRQRETQLLAELEELRLSIMLLECLTIVLVGDSRYDKLYYDLNVHVLAEGMITVGKKYHTLSFYYDNLTPENATKIAIDSQQELDDESNTIAVMSSSEEDSESESSDSSEEMEKPLVTTSLSRPIPSTAIKYNVILPPTAVVGQSYKFFLPRRS